MGLFTTAEIQQWIDEYHPCRNGVHVFDPEGGSHGGKTVKNFPSTTLDAFRLHTSIDQTIHTDDFDLLCDLYEGGDLMDTVTIRRQDLALIERVLEATP